MQKLDSSLFTLAVHQTVRQFFCEKYNLDILLFDPVLFYECLLPFLSLSLSAQACSEYFNTRPLVRDEWILLLEKLIFKSFALIGKLKIWENINTFSQ